MKFAAGQQWTYDTPTGHEASRIVIGAVATCASGEHIICFSVFNAPRIGPAGEVEVVTIPFVPMSKDAFEKTIVEKLETPSHRPDFQMRFKRGAETSEASASSRFPSRVFSIG